CHSVFFFVFLLLPPIFPLFPYTALFRSSSIRRIYAVGVACAILTVFIGFALERARFGSSDEDALSRAERSVRAEIAVVTAALSEDRKSTRLNSSHLGISYAVFCLKKKKK